MSLDTFTMAYIECALWASNATDDATGEEYEGLDEFSIDDIDAETVDAMMHDCAKFQADNAALLERAAGLGEYAAGRWTPEELAGHDFWLTRNGHGAGFWDRGLGDVGERLTEAAHAYGAAYLWLENGTIFAD